MSAETANAAQVLGWCARCGEQIKHAGGPSWTHLQRPKIGGNHPAYPNDESRKLVQP